jgi:hypothetical protein
MGHRMIAALQRGLSDADTGPDILAHRHQPYHLAGDPLNWTVSVEAAVVVLNQYILDTHRVGRSCQFVEHHMDWAQRL